MDLGGPKLRTGPDRAAQRAVVKLKPERDDFGRVTRAGEPGPAAAGRRGVGGRRPRVRWASMPLGSERWRSALASS